MTVIQWLCHYKCFSLFCKSDNIEWQSCNKVYIFLLNSSSLHLLHDILEATFKWSCQILIIITSEFLVQIQSWSLHIFFLSWCWFVFDCAGSGNLQLHRSGATLWLLTGEVNNTDCLFIMAPVRDILGSKWTICPQRRSRKTCPTCDVKLQCFWGVPGL